ncbi:MAG TPA: FAD:protein FMN transferase [Candidatus Krumholzibacteria bacterium]|nr:FAD:protein FMN transferase [Candidatus Krumholzibacteria bacterium]
MKRIVAIAGLLALAALPGRAQTGAAPRPVIFRTQTMGTWASLTLVTADSAAVSDVAYRSLLVLHRVDSLMSNWTTTSEVARINRVAGSGATPVHPEVAEVIGVAQTVTRESGGAFDITVEPLVRLWGFLDGTPHVPSQSEIDRARARVGPGKIHFDASAGTIRFERDDVRIDLGGIAKGYGVDQVASLLRAEHVTSALIDLSGNMVAIGGAVTHPGWNVGIRDPSGVYPMLGRIRLENDAIATSGDYEQFVSADGKRYGHILDPRTGWSAHGLSSATVVAGAATLCDAWATALFVLGPDAARATARARSDIAVVLVEPNADGTTTIWVEEQLRNRFAPEAELPSTFVTRYF